MLNKRIREEVVLSQEQITKIMQIKGGDCKICGNCNHFRLHYVKHSLDNYIMLQYGHCVRPGFRERYAVDEPCPHWQEKK